MAGIQIKQLIFRTRTQENNCQNKTEEAPALIDKLAGFVAVCCFIDSNQNDTEPGFTIKSPQ